MLQKLDWLALAGLLVFVCYFALASLSAASDDFFYHLSIVDSFQRNFLHPQHESLSLSSAYLDQHMPYHFLVAFGGKVLGLSSFRAMRIAGMLNLAYLVCAVVVFLKCWTLSLRSALFAGLVYFLFSTFLRNYFFSWSNDISIYGLHFILAYPSTFSFATSFILFTATLEYLKNPRVGWLGCIAFLVFMTFLNHLPTGSYAVLAMVLLALTEFLKNRRDPKRFKRIFSVLLAGAVGLWLCLFWPYYRFTIWTSAVHNTYDNYVRIYDHAIAMALPITICAIPVFWFYAKRRENVFLLLCSAACGLIHFLSYFMGMYVFGRYVFFYLSCTAILLALAARQGWERNDLPQRVRVYFRILPVLPLLACFILPVQWEKIKWSGRIFTKMIRHPSSYDEIILSKMAMFKHVLTPTDIVLINPNNAFTFEANRIAAFTGAKFVYGHRWNIMTHPQAQERLEDAWRFFQTASASERQMIVQKYQATVILLRRDEVSQGKIHPSLLAQLGKPHDQNDTFFYYRIRR